MIWYPARTVIRDVLIRGGLQVNAGNVRPRLGLLAHMFEQQNAKMPFLIIWIDAKDLQV